MFQITMVQLGQKDIQTHTPDYLGGSQNSGFVSATISDSGEVMVWCN